MNNLLKKPLCLYIVSVFILFVIPIYVVISNTTTLSGGQEYLFKVTTYDPYDMFRGNYLRIEFAERKATAKEIDNSWEYEKKSVYATIQTDEEGFAFFEEASVHKPKNNSQYFKTKGTYIKNYLEIPYWSLETPTRYYMNENKAQKAEEIYRRNLNSAYVKVRVKNGKMAIIGIYINDELIDSKV